MTTAIEQLQSALNGLGLKSIEARLENLLEQVAKTEPMEILSKPLKERNSRASMQIRDREFSTGILGKFHPALTDEIKHGRRQTQLAPLGVMIRYKS